MGHSEHKGPWTANGLRSHITTELVLGMHLDEDRHISCGTRSEEETIELGRWIGSMLQPGDHVYVQGELGTGKTRLAKGIIATYAGIDPDDVVSPTFTLLNRYGDVQTIFHADLYRIDRPDLDDVGLDIVWESNSVLVVEWPEKIMDLDDASLIVTISYGEGEEDRSISLEWTPQSVWDDRMRRESRNTVLASRDSRLSSDPHSEQLHNGEHPCRS